MAIILPNNDYKMTLYSLIKREKRIFSPKQYVKNMLQNLVYLIVFPLEVCITTTTTISKVTTISESIPMFLIVIFTHLH